VYPYEKVVIVTTKNPSSQRFLIEQCAEYVHVTDADILILPHKLTHYEYYSQYKVRGASYLRGCTEGGGVTWTGDSARICGGHVQFYPEYYEDTKKKREYFMKNLGSYREFDEVMLSQILKDSDYPIPEKPYTFNDGTEWNKEYRDLHLQDFASFKFEKWKPDKAAIRDLFEDAHFNYLVSQLDSFWRMIFKKVNLYANNLDVHA
jgi:hypothetical protein